MGLVRSSERDRRLDPAAMSASVAGGMASFLARNRAVLMVEEDRKTMRGAGLDLAEAEADLGEIL